MAALEDSHRGSGHAAALRVAAAITAGKLAGAASRAFRRGGGTSVPGLLAERIEPHLAERLAAQLGHGSLIVTGTNGKTTTAHMLNSITERAGLRPLHNRSGSNLMRGVATTLIEQAGPSGHLIDAEQRLGVFEVDEATLPEAVRALKPRVVIFTNLFRDQLDRYGEVDAISARWHKTLEAAPDSMIAVLNADDPSVATLQDSARGPVLFYGIDDRSSALASPEHAADSRWCPVCGSEYDYDPLYYGHIGRWRCRRCKRSRPQPEVRARQVRLEPGGNALFGVITPQGAAAINLKLSGLYNVYNALAALAGGLALGFDLEAVREGVADIEAAFGRQESFDIDGRQVQVFLAKNPTGLNQVLRTIAAAPGEKHLLLFLNDDVADGRDVSWIWDAEFEMVATEAASVVVSGRRAEDMALRLKYAGFPPDPAVISETHDALAQALKTTPVGGKLYVVPTYTAMLEVRELLARHGGISHYWEGQS